jgi:hypothetical protein
VNAVLALLIAVSVFAEPADSDWKLINENSDIKVFRHEVEGMRLVAFKGTGPVHAPIAKVAGAVLDEKRATEWVDKLKEVRVIKHPNPHEWVAYSAVSSGYWLIKDRDFVYRMKLDISPESKTVTLKYEPAAGESVPPVRNYVRGEIINSTFTFTPIEDGAGTMVTAEILVDPKGAIPKWIVNLAQKSWPINTIERLRVQAAKPDIVEHPEVKEAFEEKKDSN